MAPMSLTSVCSADDDNGGPIRPPHLHGSYASRHRSTSSPTRLLRAAPDDADAVLHEAAISEAMKDVDHVVVTTGERSEDPGSFQNVEVESSDDVGSPFAVWNILNVPAGECHRQRATRKVVRREHAAELNEEVADFLVAFATAVTIASTRVLPVLFWQATDGKNLRRAERAVPEVHQRQSEVGNADDR